MNPDTVLLNGRIFTVDHQHPWAEALAIRGEWIVGVGSNRDMKALAGPGTRTIDLDGRLVVPGFNDAHVHFIAGAEELVGVNLRRARSEREICDMLSAHVATQPPGRWVLGGYWDHEAWPGRRLPNRTLLDSVVPDRPVFLKRLDGHMGVANSAALAMAAIGRDTAAPEGGSIDRDDSGELTGILRDRAMELVESAIPAPGSDELLDRARAAFRHAASLGVTSIHDMTASPSELHAYQKLRAEGDLTARVYSIQMGGAMALAAAGLSTGFGDDWLRVGGAKLFADGSMGARTAWFAEPYDDDPGNTGLLLQPLEELERAMFSADEAGYQLVVHAIGDAANTAVLDVLARLTEARGRSLRRPRIEHAQVVRRPDLARFVSLGVVASLQPSHATDDMRWAERRIGRERCQLAYNVRSFLHAGARVAFGTDWFVEPLDPMLGLHAAVTRQAPEGGAAFLPQERIEMAAAIEHYTLGSAYAEFAETRKGCLSEGMLADLVVLSANLFEIAPREILSTRPLLTMVGGKVVYGD
jgi:predicted amidohydrolase YtcJ